MDRKIRNVRRTRRTPRWTQPKTLLMTHNFINLQHLVFKHSICKLLIFKLYFYAWFLLFLFNFNNKSLINDTKNRNEKPNIYLKFTGFGSVSVIKNPQLSVSVSVSVIKNPQYRFRFRFRLPKTGRLTGFSVSVSVIRSTPS